MLSPHTRLKRQRSLQRRKLYRALRIEVEAFVPHDNFTAKWSPLLWKGVFLRVYREPPSGDADERWDHLLKLGIPLMRRILKK